MASFRQIVPRVSRLAMMRPQMTSCCPSRNFFNRHGPMVPWGFRGGPFRAMEDQMRQMQKLMDSVMPSYEYAWPMSRIQRLGAKDMEVKYDDKKFELKIDVKDYTPEEVNVKLTGDKLSITGKHSEKEDDYGVVSREFSRQIQIPENVELESLESMLTNCGTLVISGKVKGAENIEERTINIQREPPKTETKEE